MAREANTPDDKYHHGYGQGDGPGQDYQHAHNEKRDWTPGDDATVAKRKEQYQKRLDIFKKKMGLQTAAELNQENLGKTYTFQKGDTLYPALKDFYGMNERTAFLVMIKLLHDEVNVDLIQPDDFITLTGSGDTATLKVKIGTVQREYSDILKTTVGAASGSRAPAEKDSKRAAVSGSKKTDTADAGEMATAKPDKASSLRGGAAGESETASGGISVKPDGEEEPLKPSRTDSTPPPSATPIPTPDTKLPQTAPPGFAKLLKISDAEASLSQFSNEQKLAILGALSKGEALVPQQNHRLQQIGIIRTVLESIVSEIDGTRTWGEWMNQTFAEQDHTTSARTTDFKTMIRSLDIASAIIQKDPNKTVDELISTQIKDTLKKYDLYDTTDTNITKDPQNVGEMQEQYLSLMRFLRQRKDYLTAQHLVEDTLLAPHFAKKRDELDKNQKDILHDKATAKINTMVTSEVSTQWSSQGMTDDQITTYKLALIEEDASRAINKHIAQLNGGRPFTDLDDKDTKIMEAYRDMMGYGSWNIADTTWDSIIEEVIINAPLIIVSGGIASAGRAAVTAGVRTAIATGRLARIGLAAANITAAGGKARVVITATNRLGKTLYWGGRAGGLFVEGALFETAHAGLQGTWIGNMPDWGKQIVWSSITLGAFHGAGKFSKKINDVIAKNLTKVTEKSVVAGIQAFLIQGNIEAATMLLMGAVQHGFYNGTFEDWNMVEEIVHAFVSVGALHVAGSVIRPVIEIGSKKFFGKGEKEAPDGAPLHEKIEIKVGDEVYVQRKINDVVERGWRVRNINADGSYHLENINNPTIQKPDTPPDTILRIEEIENPRDSKVPLPNEVWEFERRKFQTMKAKSTLDQAQYDSLFGTWEMKQDNVGNCYLISALNALRVSPHFTALIRTSIRIVPGGWEVKIPLSDPTAKIILVKSKDLAPQLNPQYKKQDPFTHSADMREYLNPVKASRGYQILEAAFIKHKNNGKLDRSVVDQGGFGHQSLLSLIGGTFYGLGIVINVAENSPHTPQLTENYLSTFNPGRDIATVNTPHSLRGGGDTQSFRIRGVNYDFAHGHAYSIISTLRPELTLDKKGEVVVVNPWDTSKYIKLTYPQFMQAFSLISAVRIDRQKLFAPENP